MGMPSTPVAPHEAFDDSLRCTCSGKKSLAPFAIFGFRWAPPLLNRSAMVHKKGPIAS